PLNSRASRTPGRTPRAARPADAHGAARANYGIFPALRQSFFLDIGVTAWRWSSFNEASSYEKILSELFSGIWGPDCRYRCNGLNFRPNLGTVRTSPSSVGISCARPTPQHRWEANPN